MPIRTWVGRFAIVQGQPQEEGPWLRSFVRQRADEEGDELFILVEPALPGSDEYCAGLVDAVGRLYREDNLSLTGAIVRSLQSAHQQLRDWNQRSLREHQVAAGVTCIAVRGRTAYLAQTGPSVAYHMAGGAFRRIAPETGATDPVGLPDLIQPAITRYQLSPGDLLLTASPRLASLIDEDLLQPILLRGAQDALPELFRLVREQQDFALLLLACVIEPDGDEPPAGLSYSPSSGARPSERKSPVAATPAVATTPVAETMAPDAAPASAGAPVDGISAPDVEEPYPTTDGEQPATATMPPPVEDDAEAVGDASTSDADYYGEAHSVAADVPAAPPGGVDLAEVKVRLRGASEGVRYPRTTGWQARLPRVPPALIVGALLLAVLGLGAYCIIPPALEESQNDRFSSRLAEASEAFSQARDADDPAEQREALGEAQAKLAEAGQIRANDPELEDLQLQVTAALAELDAVLELPDPQLVVNLSERVPGPLSVSELSVGGGGAFFLDREQGRVIAITLLAPNPEPFVLFAAGTQVDAELSGPAQHVAWADGIGALLVLDDARRLFAVVPGLPPRLLAVRDAGAWGSADGIAYAGGFLYVLDRENDQVWKYQATENGFDSEREPLVASAELEQAVQMVIDKALYVVLEDGELLRFLGGVETAFPLAGIDKAVADPASPLFLPASQRLLVVDRGNKRVVEASPDGVFRQQLMSPLLSDLRAVGVDEPNGLLYLLDGASLLQTPLPPAPPP